MAWDTMAVLMAAYQSSEAGGGFVDVRGIIGSREFGPEEGPQPDILPEVFQTA